QLSALSARRSEVPRIIITHGAQDIDRWLQGKAERAGAIESTGASNVTDYVAQDGSKNVGISADVAEVEPLVSMTTAPPPEVAALMEKHGVLPPLVIYVEA